jgi:heptosyltransferase-2
MAWKRGLLCAPLASLRLCGHRSGRSSVYKILVIGPSWVGDTVLAQPLFKRLHEKHAQLELDVLAPAWTLPLLARMPEVSEGLASPFGHGDLGLVQRWRLARELRARRYDQAIVLPNSFKSALIPRLAGIGLRTGFVGEARQPLLNDARRLDPEALPLMAERFAHLADARDEPLRRPLPQPALSVSPAARDALLARLGLRSEPPVACFCPGAEYGPAKRWPAEHFASLAARLADHGWQVWLIGSPKDRVIGAQIQRSSGARCRDLCGATGLAEAVDLLSLAQVVVSNDSGLMHVAAALDRPMLALYGSSSPSFTPPLSPQAQVVKLDLPCSPCFQRECPLGHFKCLRDLAPERIFERVGHIVRPPVTA